MRSGAARPMVGTRSGAIRRSRSKDGDASLCSVLKKQSGTLRPPRLSASAEAPKEASRHAAPDARERIPTGAGAARPYHFSGAHQRFNSTPETKAFLAVLF